MNHYKVKLISVAVVEAKSPEEAYRIAKKGEYTNGEEVGFEFVDEPTVKRIYKITQEGLE
jgi:hypothetical protein|tara:strand:- start:806 stop:985 length:180 start_codon:yes stop_codon:yes gene_type:complete